MSSKNTGNEVESAEERIQQLEERVEQLEGRNDVSRRKVLQGAGLLGVGGLLGGSAKRAVGTAAADEGSGSIGTEENPLDQIYVNELYQNEDHLRPTTVGSENNPVSEVHTSAATPTFKVPTDFSTVHEALNGITQLLPPSEDSEVTIQIESGHEIETPIVAERGDYNHITITSEDETVNVGSDFPDNNAIIRVQTAYSPTIGVLIDANGYGSDGIHVNRWTCTIASECGVINAGSNGLRAENGSVVNAWGADFRGAGNDGARIQKGSIADFGASQSTPNVSNAGRHGLLVRRASVARFQNGDATDAAEDGIRVNRCAHVDAEKSDVSGSDRGFRSMRNSSINAFDATANNCEARGLSATYGGYISADRIEVLDSDDRGAEAQDLGKIDLTLSEVSGSDREDLAVFNGGQMNANDCETTNGSPSNDDIHAISVNDFTEYGFIFG